MVLFFNLSMTKGVIILSSFQVSLYVFKGINLPLWQTTVCLTSPSWFSVRSVMGWWCLWMANFLPVLFPCKLSTIISCRLYIGSKCSCNLLIYEKYNKLFSFWLIFLFSKHGYLAKVCNPNKAFRFHCQSYHVSYNVFQRRRIDIRTSSEAVVKNSTLDFSFNILKYLFVRCLLKY